MKEIKKNKSDKSYKNLINNERYNDIICIKINPTKFMDVVYGNPNLYLNKDYNVEGSRIGLASKIAHAGNGCIPGKAAVFVTVDKTEKIKSGLYRYKLKDIDVFEPVQVESYQETTYLSGDFNMLDDPDNTEWLELFFYPYINGAYIDYKDEWNIPEPEYL